MTSGEVCKLWAEANHRHMKTHPDERFGQALFNRLHEARPDLADKIRGTDLDPFYKFPEEGYGKEVFDNLWDWLQEQPNK